MQVSFLRGKNRKGVINLRLFAIFEQRLTASVAAVFGHN
jgi:hypothetical protein